jgi:hypothetical protein
MIADRLVKSSNNRQFRSHNRLVGPFDGKADACRAEQIGDRVVRVVLIACLLPALAVSAPKPGEDGTPEYRIAIDLVHDLGNARFTVREAAAKKLVDMGSDAIPALIAGTKSTDEEVRNRSTALLPQARAVAWGRRADAFLADPDDKKAGDMPLLAEWEKLAGRLNAGSRRMYADMIRANGHLLELTATDRPAARAAISARTAELLDAARLKGKQIEAPAADIAALLFVQAYLKDSEGTHGAAERREPLYLLANPAVAKALDAKDFGQSYRRLIVKWAESRPADETMSGLFFALLAHRHPFPEADEHLIRLVTSSKNVQIRWVAMESLGRSPSPAARKKLTELLTDTTTMYTDVGEDDVGHQVRDCALAALANGQGKKPTDFGLTNIMTANFWAGGQADTITISLHAFKSSGDRDGGIKKWLADSAAKK